MSFEQHLKLHDQRIAAHLQFCYETAIVGAGERLADEDEGFLLVAYDSKPAFDMTVISKNYDINTLQYVEEYAPNPVFNEIQFNEDGTLLVGCSFNGLGELASITLHSLSTPWRFNSATQIGEFVPSQITDTVNDDIQYVKIVGSTMYAEFGGTVYKYNLTADWDISSPSEVATDGAFSFGDIKFNDDGTKAFTASGPNADDIVVEYALSTPYDLFSRTLTTRITESTIPVVGSKLSLAIVESGTKILVNCGDPGAILFTLGTAYDLTSLTSTVSKDPFTGQSPQLRSLFATPLTNSFPSDPSYVDLDNAVRGLNQIAVDIQVYSLSNLKEFKMYYTPSGGGETFVEAIPATSTDYTFTGLNSGTDYTLKIEAIDLNDNVVVQGTLASSTFSEELVFSEDSKTETSVTLSWTEDNDNVNGYNLLVDGNQDNGAEISIATAEGGYLIDGLSAGTSYSITVEALDINDNIIFTDTTSITTLTQVLTSLNEDFEGLALGQVPAGWSQSAGSDFGWIVTDQRASGGTKSLGSDPNNGDNQTAAIEVTIDLAAQNTLNFDYRASTEPGFDFMYFYIDGVQQLAADNDTIWRNYNELISAGQHTLKWEFVKDGSIGSLDDRCYIDNVITTPV